MLEKSRSGTERQGLSQRVLAKTWTSPSGPRKLRSANTVCQVLVGSNTKSGVRDVFLEVEEDDDAAATSVEGVTTVASEGEIAIGGGGDRGRTGTDLFLVAMVMAAVLLSLMIGRESSSLSFVLAAFARV